MRICIPTETAAGKEAIVYGHFGSAPYFTVYDTDKNLLEVIDNSDQDHVHGQCRPTATLDGKNVDAVVCGGMGARAVQRLNQKGIRVYRAAGGTVEETIAQFESDGLDEFTTEDACSGHECH